MSLNNLLAEAIGLLQEQTRSIPKCYDLVRRINMASKTAIEALKSGNKEALARAKDEMTTLWGELGRVNVPRSTGCKFDSDAGQEIAEFYVVEAYYPYIVGESADCGSVPSWMHLDMPIQAWLSGVEDSVGELSKMLGSYLLRKDLSLEMRMGARERFLKVSDEIHAFLNGLLGADRVSDAVRSSGDRLRYPDTFRGKMGRVEGNIERNRERQIELLDRISLGGTK